MNVWRGRRIPLAWLLLTRQPARLAVALAGIAFAGILMFMQLGFRDGLFDASVTIHRQFDADLVLISPRTMSSIAMAGFPQRRLVQAMVPGYEAQRNWLRQKALTIAGGTQEIQLNIIAKRVLGLPD